MSKLSATRAARGLRFGPFEKGGETASVRVRVIYGFDIFERRGPGFGRP